VPAANTLTVPRGRGTTLGLTGRFLYLFVRPVIGRLFVIHVEVHSEYDLINRISLSNMYKQVRAEQNLVQYPCPDFGGRWAVIALDLDHIVRNVSDRKYMAVKSVQFCASLFVRTCVVSDHRFGPETLPRNVQLHVPPDATWAGLYAWKWFPDGPVGYTEPPIRASAEAVAEALGLARKKPAPAPPVHRAGDPRALRSQPARLSASQVAAMARAADNPNLVASDLPSLGGPAGEPALVLTSVLGFSGRTPDLVRALPGGSGMVFAVDHVLVVQSLASGRQTHMLGHTAPISCLDVQADGSTIVTASRGRHPAVRIWDARQARCLAVTAGPAADVCSVALSPTGRLLCAAGKDGHAKDQLCLWDLSCLRKTGKATLLLKQLCDHDIRRVVFSPFDPTHFATCGLSSLRLWRPKKDVYRSTSVALGEHFSTLFTALAYESPATAKPGTVRLFAATATGLLFCVNVGQHVVDSVFRLHTGAIHSLAVNHGLCATGSDDKTVRVWPLDFSQYTLESALDAAVTSVSFAAESPLLVVGTSTCSLSTLDVASQTLAVVLPPVTCTVRIPDAPARVSLDDRHVAVAAGALVRVLDVDTLAVFFEVEFAVECTAVAVRDGRLAVGGADGGLRVIEIDGGSLIAESRQHEGRVTAVVFACGREDGRHYVYTAAEDGTVCVYDEVLHYTPIKLLVSYGPHAGAPVPVTSLDPVPPAAKPRIPLAVSSTGDSVAVSGPDGRSVVLFESGTLTQRTKILLPGPHVSRVAALCFASEDSEIVATMDNGDLLRLSINTRSLVRASTKAHVDGPPLGLAVDSESKLIITGGSDGLVKAWPYHLRRQISGDRDGHYQMFVGHAGPITDAALTLDNRTLITLSAGGNAIFIWSVNQSNSVFRAPTDNHNHLHHDTDRNAMTVTDFSDGELVEEDGGREAGEVDDDDGQTAPPAHGGSNNNSNKLLHFKRHDNPAKLRPSHQPEEEASPRTAQPPAPSRAPVARPGNAAPQHVRTISRSGNSGGGGGDGSSSPSRALADKLHGLEARVATLPFSHTLELRRPHPPAQRLFVAGPQEAVLSHRITLGVSSQGHSHVCWHPEAALLAYPAGCDVLIEDLVNQRQRQLRGHTAPVTVLALSSTARRLVSASGLGVDVESSVILVWDVSSPVPPVTGYPADAAVPPEVARARGPMALRHHFAGVQALSISSDERRLVSVGSYLDMSLCVWDLVSGLLLASSELAATTNVCGWIPGSTSEFATAGEGRRCTFWTVDDISRKGSVALSSYEAVWPLDRVREQGRPQYDGFHVTAMAFGGPSGMVLGSSTGMLSFWDLINNSCVSTLSSRTEHEIVLLSWGAGRLLAAGLGPHIEVWTMRGSESLSHPTSTVSSRVAGVALDGPAVAWACDASNTELIVGTASGTVYYVNLLEDQCSRVASGHVGAVYSAAWLADEQHFVTGGEDGTFRLWSALTGEQEMQFQVHDDDGGDVTTTAVATPQGPSEQAAAVGRSDGTVRVYSTSTGVLQARVVAHPGQTVTAMCFISDDDYIVSGSDRGHLCVIDRAAGQVVQQFLDPHGGFSIDSISAHPLDDNLFCTSSRDGVVCVWRVDPDLEEISQVMVTSMIEREADLDLSPFPALVQFCPTRPTELAYTACVDPSAIRIVVFDFEQMEVVRTIPLLQPALTMHINRDNLVAVGTADRLVKVIDFDQGTFQDYATHADSVLAVSFSSSGNQLLSAGGSDVVLWNVKV
jgi:WD40 repeat protein